jgi:hypothetical protein
MNAGHLDGRLAHGLPPAGEVGPRTTWLDQRDVDAEGGDLRDHGLIEARPRALAGAALGCLDAADLAWTASVGKADMPVLIKQAMAAGRADQ